MKTSKIVSHLLSLIAVLMLISIPVLYPRPLKPVVGLQPAAPEAAVWRRADRAVALLPDVVMHPHIALPIGLRPRPTGQRGAALSLLLPAATGGRAPR